MSCLLPSSLLLLLLPRHCLPHSSPWKSLIFETRASPPLLESNLRASFRLVLSNLRSTLPPSPCSPSSRMFPFLSPIAHSCRMTCLRRCRMDPSRCSIAIPDRFVSSRTNSAASPNTLGIALFLAHFAPASWATCSGCLRSCGERKAFRSSTSSRSLGSKREARLAYYGAPARKMSMDVRLVGRCGIKSLFLRKETQWNIVF